MGYWEPAKLVAKLREHKTDDRLLLLKTEMGAGHFSVTGRFERLKEVRRLGLAWAVGHRQLCYVGRWTVVRPLGLM